MASLAGRFRKNRFPYPDGGRDVSHRKERKQTQRERYRCPECSGELVEDGDLLAGWSYLCISCGFRDYREFLRR